MRRVSCGPRLAAAACHGAVLLCRALLGHFLLVTSSLLSYIKPPPPSTQLSAQVETTCFGRCFGSICTRVQPSAQVEATRRVAGGQPSAQVEATHTRSLCRAQLSAQVETTLSCKAAGTSSCELAATTTTSIPPQYLVPHQQPTPLRGSPDHHPSSKAVPRTEAQPQAVVTAINAPEIAGTARVHADGHGVGLHQDGHEARRGFARGSGLERAH